MEHFERHNLEVAYHVGGLKEKLIEAALATLQEGGSDLSLRALARVVGVSPMAAYRHFRDKQDLMAAVAEHGFRRLLESMEPPAEGFRKPEARFKHLVGAYIRFGLANPGLLRLMFGSEITNFSDYPTLTFFSRQCFSRFQQATLALPERRAHPTRGAVAAWSLVHGNVLLILDRSLVHLDEPERPSPDELAEMMLGGLLLS